MVYCELTTGRPTNQNAAFMCSVAYCRLMLISVIDITRLQRNHRLHHFSFSLPARNCFVNPNRFVCASCSMMDRLQYEEETTNHVLLIKRFYWHTVCFCLHTLVFKFMTHIRQIMSEYFTLSGLQVK